MSIASDRADFEHFVEFEALPASPLYATLAEVVARDDSLLALVAGRIPGEPAPNMLFGAVHRLLMDRRDHPLAAFYASMTDAPRPREDAAAPFRDFCREEAAAIREIARTRRVQTNEARRSGVLLPALYEIARREGRPVALVDVGTSAGFTLLVDRWRITYVGMAGMIETGPADALVRFTIAARGARLPPVGREPLPLAAAVGIDPEPIDASNDESARWLEALIWPEQPDRRTRLREALAVARAHPPSIVRGDAVEVLPAVLEALPEHAVPVITHTHVMSKIPPEGRLRLDAAISAASRGRVIHRLGNDFSKMEGTVYTLEHATYRGGNGNGGRVPIARCAPHATWVEWL